MALKYQIFPDATSVDSYVHYDIKNITREAQGTALWTVEPLTLIYLLLLIASRTRHVIKIRDIILWTLARNWGVHWEDIRSKEAELVNLCSALLVRLGPRVRCCADKMSGRLHGVSITMLGCEQNPPLKQESINALR